MKIILSAIPKFLLPNAMVWFSYFCSSKLVWALNFPKNLELSNSKILAFRNCVSFVDQRQAKIDRRQVNSSGQNSETISEWTKFFMVEQQVKSKNRWATKRNSSHENNEWIKSY